MVGVVETLFITFLLCTFPKYLFIVKFQLHSFSRYPVDTGCSSHCGRDIRAYISTFTFRVK